MGSLNSHVILKFNRHLSSTAAEVPVKLHTNCTILYKNLVTSRLCEIGYWNGAHKPQLMMKLSELRSLILASYTIKWHHHLWQPPMPPLITKQSPWQGFLSVLISIFHLLLCWVDHDKQIQNDEIKTLFFFVYVIQTDKDFTQCILSGMATLATGWNFMKSNLTL